MINTISKNAIHERYKKKVAVHARKYQIYNTPVEDMEQELWVAIMKALPKHDRKRGASEKTYIERVCANKVKDLLRKAGTELKYRSNLYIG